MFYLLTFQLKVMLKLINGAEKTRNNLMSTIVYLTVLVKSVAAYLNWLNEYPRLREEQNRRTKTIFHWKRQGGWEKIRKNEKKNEKRKGHKPTRIRSGRHGGVECGVWRNYYWIMGNNEEMNGWGWIGFTRSINSTN